MKKVILIGVVICVFLQGCAIKSLHPFYKEENRNIKDFFLSGNVILYVNFTTRQNLDPKAAAELVVLLIKQKKAGKAILMCTHDIFRAKELADYVGIIFIKS